MTHTPGTLLTDVVPAPAPRRAYVDVFRGLLIAHMALDHASLMFNAGRGGEELAAAPAPVVDGLFQFLTRFTGVPVRSGLLLHGGIHGRAHQHRAGESRCCARRCHRRLIVRGLVLIAVDALIMGLPAGVDGIFIRSWC